MKIKMIILSYLLIVPISLINALSLEDFCGVFKVKNVAESPCGQSVLEIYKNCTYRGECGEGIVMHRRTDLRRFANPDLLPEVIFCNINEDLAPDTNKKCVMFSEPNYTPIPRDRYPKKKVPSGKNTLLDNVLSKEVITSMTGSLFMPLRRKNTKTTLTLEDNKIHFEKVEFIETYNWLMGWQQEEPHILRCTFEKE